MRISVTGITKKYPSPEVTPAVVVDYFRWPLATTGLKRRFLGNLSAFTVAYKLLSVPPPPKSLKNHPQSIGRRVKILLQKVTVTREKLYEMYWKQQKSIRQIARLHGISCETVWRQMNKHGIARRDKNVAVKLALTSPEVRRRMSLKLRKKFVAYRSSSLAYLLGVLLGDGYVCKVRKTRGGHTYLMGLCVKDRIFAEKFAKTLSKIRLNPYIHTEKRGFHRVRATSVDFYEWYKSLSLEQIRELINGFERQFVCGFYESAGSISLDKSGMLYIQIRNKRRELLSMIQDILDGWGIETRLRGPYMWDCFTLAIYGKNRVERFLKNIKPCIKTWPKGHLKKGRFVRLVEDISHLPKGLEPSSLLSWRKEADFSGKWAQRSCEQREKRR